MFGRLAFSLDNSLIFFFLRQDKESTKFYRYKGMVLETETSRPYSFIHLANKYLLSSYVPDIVSGIRHIAKEIDKLPILMELTL